MEVTSYFLENEDLGSLHVSRFIPPNVSTDEIGMHFGGVYSRATTIDTFGTAYIMASERNMVIDVVDRPGNGASTMPESSSLREDYIRFGFIAVRDAILDAQAEDSIFNNASRIHASGMSLGGQVAVQYLNGVGDRASSAVLIDSAGLRHKASQLEAVGRYFVYLGIEFLADKTGCKPSVDDVFSGEYEILEAFTQFTHEHPHLLTMPKQDKAGKAEFRELSRLSNGTGLGLVISLLQEALADNRPFELRASRSGARFISDNRSVGVINQAFADLDAESPNINQSDSIVRYGFSQNGPWWHSLAITPKAVRSLITTPISQLQNRLK